MAPDGPSSGERPPETTEMETDGGRVSESEFVLEHRTWQSSLDCGSAIDRMLDHVFENVEIHESDRNEGKTVDSAVPMIAMSRRLPFIMQSTFNILSVVSPSLTNKMITFAMTFGNADRRSS